MDTLAKHTPGPWTVATSERTLRQQLLVSGIAVKAYAPRHDTECAIFNISTNSAFGGDDATIANARLIAAAPEMLAALKECADLLEFLQHEYSLLFSPDGAHALAKAAIAKATGA